VRSFGGMGEDSLGAAGKERKYCLRRGRERRIDFGVLRGQSGSKLKVARRTIKDLSAGSGKRKGPRFPCPGGPLSRRKKKKLQKVLEIGKASGLFSKKGIKRVFDQGISNLHSSEKREKNNSWGRTGTASSKKQLFTLRGLCRSSRFGGQSLGRSRRKMQLFCAMKRKGGGPPRELADKLAEAGKRFLNSTTEDELRNEEKVVYPKRSTRESSRWDTISNLLKKVPASKGAIFSERERWSTSKSNVPGAKETGALRIFAEIFRGEARTRRPQREDFLIKNKRGTC